MEKDNAEAGDQIPNPSISDRGETTERHRLRVEAPRTAHREATASCHGRKRGRFSL